MDHRVSSRNIAALITIMILCTLLITGFSTIGQDMWIAVIAGAVMSVPLILMYSRIISINPGLDLFQIIYKNFGRVTGSILVILLSWYALHVSALETKNFSEFVVTISLENTPKIFIIIGMIAVGGYLASTNCKVMGRWSFIILIIVAITFAITILLAVPSMDFSYIKPIMSHNIKEILSTAFSFASLSLFETVIALVVFGSMKSKDSPYKAYFTGIVLGIFLLLCAILRNLFVIGREMVAASIFPSYVTVRIVNPGSFIEHIESIVSFNMILMGITKISICLRAAAVGIARLLGLHDMTSKFILPVCLLAISICVTTFSNMQELIEFVQAYRYYAIPFTMLIPFIIWIKSEIRKRKTDRLSKNLSV